MDYIISANRSGGHHDDRAVNNGFNQMRKREYGFVIQIPSASEVLQANLPQSDY